jgi:hypothetical protein
LTLRSDPLCPGRRRRPGGNDAGSRCGGEGVPRLCGDDPRRTRAQLFFKAAEIVKRRSDEIAEVLANETGGTINVAGPLDRAAELIKASL